MLYNPYTDEKLLKAQNANAAVMQSGVDVLGAPVDYVVGRPYRATKNAISNTRVGKDFARSKERRRQMAQSPRDAAKPLPIGSMSPMFSLVSGSKGAATKPPTLSMAPGRNPAADERKTFSTTQADGGSGQITINSEEVTPQSDAEITFRSAVQGDNSGTREQQHQQFLRRQAATGNMSADAELGELRQDELLADQRQQETDIANISAEAATGKQNSLNEIAANKQAGKNARAALAEQGKNTRAAQDRKTTPEQTVLARNKIEQNIIDRNLNEEEANAYRSQAEQTMPGLFPSLRIKTVDDYLSGV